MQKTKLILLFSLVFGAKLFSQDLPEPELLRYNEDYSFLKDSTRTWYEKFKYIPLSENGNTYLSLGGEARMEFTDFNNEDWGRTDIGNNPFFLQRYSLHADLHLGNRVRVFGQIRSALEDGRNNGPRTIDEDQLAIQNLFLDVDVIKNDKEKLTARIGRQELNYGSGRLISVREGPNVRLNFDGVKLMYSRDRFTSDVFVMADVILNKGVFDNKSTKKANLWGMYNTIVLAPSHNLDVYYLGVSRNSTNFNDSTAKELRHSIGARLWKDEGEFLYNLEAVYQFGKIGTADISAWTASIDAAYRFENVKGTPTINLRNDYISGDSQKGDGKLQTFNPLYPKGGYFGFTPQIGPVNLIDIHPYATINLNDKMMLQADVVFNWRYSLQDGIYRPNGSLNLAPTTSKKAYIGTAFLGSLTYNITNNLTWVTGFQYFNTGSFINEEIPNHKDAYFFNTKLAFKF
ncbi:Alginate export [Soonwooa buanensis]|uniref:Alginate export n=1 Tax=Soonwooa buanensis TaxID=619805 RepID=A0A1T5FCH7_9FLAO|nr:alginate export family protein [Soonwooa buanensis]SKB93860.1 Alginate export [Soonwooa buanensis]